MAVENKLWHILGIFVGLLTAFVPAYVSYDLYGRGTVPEKRLQLNNFATIAPLSDLSRLGDKVCLSVLVQGETINNLVISKAMLQNIGSNPVLPSDYSESISVNVRKPWKILSVENDQIQNSIELKWKRISDVRFEAAPALLNPGDLVFTNVYLTDTSFGGSSEDEKTLEVDVDWKARIVNMKDFLKAPPNPMEQAREMKISVALHDWSLFFTIGAAMLFLTLYLHLLALTGLLREIKGLSIFMVLGASFLSFAAAESMATYLFGTSFDILLFGKGLGVNHLFNAPWIILHVVLIFGLYKKERVPK